LVRKEEAASGTIGIINNSGFGIRVVKIEEKEVYNNVYENSNLVIQN
jgi:hypothetical protein